MLILMFMLVVMMSKLKIMRLQIVVVLLMVVLRWLLERRMLISMFDLFMLVRMGASHLQRCVIDIQIPISRMIRARV